jgi:Flp pilus assembly pilin Flp
VVIINLTFNVFRGRVVFAPGDNIMQSLYLRTIQWLNERQECGQTLIEYGLIIGLVSILLVVGLMLLGNQLTAFYINIRNAIPGL